MSAHMKRCADAMLKSTPASGHIPATQQEWDKAVKGMKAVMYHSSRANGRSKGQAKLLTNFVYDGPLGRSLLETALASGEAGGAVSAEETSS